MDLSNVEKETIILFNEAEPTATVYTCNRALQNRLDGFCAENADCTQVKQDEYSKTYNLPKKWLRVNMPRVYTEETKQKHALTLIKAREAKNA